MKYYKISEEELNELVNNEYDSKPINFLKVKKLLKSKTPISIDKNSITIAEGTLKCIEEDKNGEPLTFCLDTTYTTDEGDLLFEWVFEKYDGCDIEIRIKK